MHIYVYTNAIFNNQKLKIHPFINNRRDKEILVCSSNGILVNNDKE